MNTLRGRSLDLPDGAAEMLDSVLPYDVQTMTYERVVILPSGVAVKKRFDVAANYEEAIDRGIDYWHKGGPIYGKDGKRIGYRAQPGWFIGGYKWRTHPMDDSGISLDGGTQTVPAEEVERLAKLQR